jgi:hypothetical protein
MRSCLLIRDRGAGPLACLVVLAVALLGLVGIQSAAAAGPTFKPAKPFLVPVAFTVAGGANTLKTEGINVKCSGETGSGKFSNAKEGKLTLKFTGCTALGEECGNVKEGEIETKELKTLLAYTYPVQVNPEGRQTGLVLSPASGGVFSEFTCATVGKDVVSGSLIAVVTPLSTRTKTLSLAIKETGNVQEPAEYETESGSKIAAALMCNFNETGLRKCGEEQVTPTITLTSEEATIEGAGAPREPAEIVNSSGKELVKKKFTGSLVNFNLKIEEAVWQLCKKGSMKGEITGLAKGTITFTLTECKGFFGEVCTSTGAKEGEVVISLPMELALLKGGKKEVALLFSFPKGGLALGCPGTMIGNFLVQMPIEKRKKEYALEMRGGKNGQSEPDEYETLSGETVKTGSAIGISGAETKRPMYFSDTETLLTFEEEVEFKQR